MDEAYHIPAMLTEAVDGLNIRHGGIYVDLTFGGGGHSREILRRMDTTARLFAFDQDIDAYTNRILDKRFTFVRSNFRYIKNFLRYHHVQQVDGILADLGVSSHHFDDEGRGFSFRHEDAPLDMRMNTSASLTAAKILNEYDEEHLSSLFRLYGELPQALKLARAIVRSRAEQPFTTIKTLLDTVTPFVNKNNEKKELACIFQALRIEVNAEMEALREMLLATNDVLRVGGRLVVISYHSLEDRMVKNYMRTGNIEGKTEKDFFGNIIAPMRMTPNKVLVPSSDEIEANPRARSAKLRIAEKIA